MLAGVPLARGDAKTRTIGVDEIKEGMKGYGLTVFKGTAPERFDVEVVGILRNFRPGQELILVKTPHPRLDVTKNVRGMSGSPIYLDGRLAGAYAYSWAAFPTEPLAGVTPIAPMLVEMRRPLAPGFWPLDGAAAKRTAALDAATRTTTSFDGAPGAYDVIEHAKQMAERLAPVGGARQLAPASTPLMMSGMSDRAAALARRLFEPLGLDPMQSGGGSGTLEGAPTHYVDGGAVGVHFVRGDVSFMGLGTVTHVEGPRACAFGHPMMSMGDAALPTSIGRVHWIFASEQHSSKIGESARPLGAMVQDRQSAIVIDETKTAPMFPLSIDIKGALSPPKSRWAMEVAEERFMTAGLVASAMGSVVEATVSERRDVTWRMRSRVHVRGHGAVDVEDFGVAVGGTPDQDDFTRARVVRLVGDVLNNPWERTRIERIESTLEVEYRRDMLRLRGAELLDPVVDAGQKARVRLHLAAWTGPTVTKLVELEMPRELAGKEVEIEVHPGWDVAPDVAAPESLPELLANAPRQSVLPRGVVVQAKLASVGVAFRGHVAHRLPGFALDALRPASGDIGPDPLFSWARAVVPLDTYLEGHAKLKVKVRAVVR